MKPPGCGHRRLFARSNRRGADADSASFKDFAKRPESAPRVISGSDYQKRTQIVRDGVFAQEQGLVKRALDGRLQHLYRRLRHMACAFQFPGCALYEEWIALQFVRPAALYIVVGQNNFRRAAFMEKLCRAMRALQINSRACEDDHRVRARQLITDNQPTRGDPGEKRPRNENHGREKENAPRAAVSQKL